jgi:hypothetical protein
MSVGNYGLDMADRGQLVVNGAVWRLSRQETDAGVSFGVQLFKGHAFGRPVEVFGFRRRAADRSNF